MEQQLDKEQKQIVQLLGGAGVVIGLLFLAVACYADPAPGQTSVPASAAQHGETQHKASPAADALTHGGAAKAGHGAGNSQANGVPGINAPVISASGINTPGIGAPSRIKPLLTRPDAYLGPAYSIVPSDEKILATLLPTASSAWSISSIRFGDEKPGDIPQPIKEGTGELGKKAGSSKSDAQVTLSREALVKDPVLAPAPLNIFATLPGKEEPAGAQSLSTAELTTLFQRAANLFWSVEPRRSRNDVWQRPVRLLPLAKEHPDQARYRAAGHAALAFIRAADRMNINVGQENGSNPENRVNPTRPESQTIPAGGSAIGGNTASEGAKGGDTGSDHTKVQLLANAQLQNNTSNSASEIKARGTKTTESKATGTKATGNQARGADAKIAGAATASGQSGQASSMNPSVRKEPLAGSPVSARAMATMLYLGGVAYYSSSDFEHARQMLERLRRDYPQYHREAYISDHHAPDPDYAHPTAPWVNKLLFVMALQNLPAEPAEPLPAEPLEVLKEFTRQAALAIEAQQEYETWIAAHRNPHDRQFLAGMQRSNPEPDQQRADSLPTVISLLEDRVYKTYLPLAIRKSGRKAVREFLREIRTAQLPVSDREQPGIVPVSATTGEGTTSARSTSVRTANAQTVNARTVSTQPAIQPAGTEEFPLPSEQKIEAPLAALALRQMLAIDKAILDGYFKRAAQLMAQSNFNGARSVLKTVIEEYSGTPAAIQAQAELQRLTAQATAKYRAEGEKHYKPDQQINVPQSQARAYFEKMYREDPEGPAADYALLHWSKALGTEGKLDQAITQLQSLLQKFPGSQFEVEAKYLIGFYYGNDKFKRFEDAIARMEQIAAEFPESAEAPEALWHAAYYCYLTGQKERGEKYLETLQRYTRSPRHRHIGDLRNMLGKTK